MDDTNLEEFKAEAMLLLKIRPHPNVIQVLGSYTSIIDCSIVNHYMVYTHQHLGVCVEQTNTYVVMEFCSRGSLVDLFGTGELTLKMKLRILKQCALGIAHLVRCLLYSLCY